MPLKIIDTMQGLYRLIENQGAIHEGGFGAVHELARDLAKAARVIDRENLKQCNGIERFDEKAGQVLASWTDQDQERSDKARDRALAKARDALAAVFGDQLKIKAQGDPRGLPLHVYLKSDDPARDPSRFGIEV